MIIDPTWRNINDAPVGRSIIIATTYKGTTIHWFRGEGWKTRDGVWEWATGETIDERFEPPKLWMDLPQIMLEETDE
ncbi:MAG: hypothetical protein AAGD43_26210 [Pseudomonadota bacterium]